MKEYLQEHVKGIAGTMIVHIAIACILVCVTLVQFEPIFPDEPGGVEVNFGTDEVGLGSTEPAPADVVTPQAQEQVTEQDATKTPEVSTSTPEEQVDVLVDAQNKDIVTQDFDEEAEAIAAQKAEQEKKELEFQKKEQEIRQEEARKLAEINQQKAKEKQAMAGKLFGKGTGTGSEGIAGGQGNQGQLNGNSDAPNYSGDPGSGGGAGGGKGVGYSLANRKAVDLPRPPKGIQAEGKVVVEILVDRNGNVIDARPGVKGSNTTNERLYQASKSAALKAKFNVSANSPERQKGTLTYIFELQ